MARGEVERKGTRQRRAQQQAAEQGRPAGGRRAFGYSRDGKTIVESEAKHIRAAYAAVLQGASLKGITQQWNDLGLKSTAGNDWRRVNLRSMLLNPRYAGLRTYRGEVVGPAIWEPVIDPATHEAAVALLTMPERRTTLTTARKYLLPGLVFCWKCGSDCATGHTQHGKRIYVCRAKKCISRKAEPVDELIEGIVIARLSRPDAADLLTTSNSPDVSIYRAQAASIRERLDDLATALEGGVLTLTAVRKSSDRLHEELGKVEAKIRDASHADVLTPLVDAADVAEVWSTLDLHQKRAVIETLMRITLLAPERGTQVFDPETVQIAWKDHA